MNWQTNYLNFKNRAALDSLKANELRGQAFSNFESSGLPTKKDEAWKYTSLTDFKNTEWTLHSGEETFLTHEQMQEVSKQLPSDFLNFVFVNGILNKTLSDDHEGFFDITEVTEQDFKTDSENVEGRLLNLAHAFLNKKIELKLAQGKTIEQPVQIVYIQSSKGAIYGSERINVELEENSEMQLLLTTISFNNGQPDAMNLNVDVKVGPSARLKLIQLQNEDVRSFHFSQVNVTLESSANVSTLVLSIGNKLTRNYYNLSFKGQNAEAQVYGVSVLDGNQHTDNYTFIQHQIGHNQSVQHYKSIVSGEAHSVFRGRVQIAQDAQKAN
ncbi:MAG: SufD family Fe-S cluster assembly protein, partial [Bdellovibrionaceae bacterium]|nr:SufD family Fe-S cluster assembly protein [Pseudobdellovibrionaceae bacterium]